MNKKGSLSLSITAIVVIVIAFVVLGLSLGFTQDIFDQARNQLNPAFDLTKLKSQPTPQDPITIPKDVEIGRNKEKKITLGYYNKDAQSHQKVSLTVLSCRTSNKDAQADYDQNPDKKPGITSVEQDVGASESVAYEILLTENGLLGGVNYICTLGAVSQGKENEPFETKQFFLFVTS